MMKNAASKYAVTPPHAPIHCKRCKAIPDGPSKASFKTLKTKTGVNLFHPKEFEWA